MQILDGLVALPRDSRTQERFEWLADEILEAGGESWIWFAGAGSVAQERELARRMADAVAGEYRSVIAAASAAAEADGTVRRRTLARLRRALQAINARDFFSPPERELARQAVDELATLVEVPS